MKFSFFKKRQTRPKSSFQKYSSIARQRKRNINSERMRSLNIGIKLPKKLLLFVGVAIFAIVIATLISSSTFKVREIKLSGDKDKESLIIQDLDPLKGQNIFLLKSGEIVGKIKEKYENIENVYIYKYIPDRIEVEIVQSQPALVFASFEKTTLVKRDGATLGDITSLGELKLLDYEIKIINGERDLNASYIKDSLLGELSDEDRKLFKFEEVKEEDREARYNRIRDEITIKVNNYKTTILNYLKSTDYAGLPFFFSYVPYEVSTSFFGVASEVSDGLKFRNLIATDNTFTSQYSLVENMDSGKQILFSTKRSIEDQFKDLDSIIFYGRYSASRIIDLRSEKYSIIK